MKILVTGATGSLGRAVVAAAAAAGHDARAMTSGRSRQPGPAGATLVTADLVTGKGLVEAVQGVDAIVHAASDPKRPEPVDVNGTRLLLDVARRARVSHLLFVSIVGIDRIPYPYYDAKRRAEDAVETASVPYSILRATQFHGFVDFMLTKASRLLPAVMPLPAGFHVQSVAVEDVARRILAALADGPKQRLRDFGGPDTMSLGEAAALWQAARGVGKRLISIPIPGRMSAGFRAGGNIVWTGDHGTIRWANWLARGAGAVDPAEDTR